MAGRDSFVEDEWLGFLKSLEAQFSASKMDKNSDLKLLFTSLLTFPPAQQC
jgi:hypothetical protein